MSPAVVLTIACSFCGRAHFPFRTHRLQSYQVICDDCLTWHYHALDVLGGALPHGCQECGARLAGLAEATPGDELKLYVVPKDGILQTLCATCARKYTGKRADLYRGTDYGRNQLKL